MESVVAADSATNEAGSSGPCTYRLVIRAEIIPDERLASADRPRWNGRALALTVGGAAALLALVWLGISTFGTDSPATPTATEATQDVKLQLPAPVSSEAAPVVSVEPRSQPPTSKAPAAATSIEASSTTTKSPESAKPDESDASTPPIKEVIPNVPRSALQTIRGTVRVSVLVTIDKQGTVIAATAEDPGPSRYFERLAMEASKKWSFLPANADTPRQMLVRFNFTREGTTARAGPPR